jgi:hypothetical protein
MRPYIYFLIVSVLLTAFLFWLDKGPYSFTPASIIGLLIVGAIYVMVLFGVFSVIYRTFRELSKLIKRQ